MRDQGKRVSLKHVPSFVQNIVTRDVFACVRGQTHHHLRCSYGTGAREWPRHPWPHDVNVRATNTCEWPSIHAHTRITPVFPLRANGQSIHAGRIKSMLPACANPYNPKPQAFGV